MAQPKFWYLRRLHVDERLPDDVKGELEEHARLERWGHQARIFREAGDSSISIILKGRVWLEDSAAAPKVTLLRGDIFGRAAVDETQGEAEPGGSGPVLRAHDDTLIAVLGREEFGEQVAPYLGNLSTRVGRFRKRRDLWVPVQPLLFTSPAERTAKVLLHLAETEGFIDESGHARLAMKLEARKLAALTGVDPLRVRKVLDALEVDKILERGSAELFIRDVDTLRQVAREGYYAQQAVIAGESQAP